MGRGGGGGARPGAVGRELEAVRRETLELVAPLDQRRLDARPGRERWSVGEILDHVRLVEGILYRELAELVGRARVGRRPELDRGLADIDASVLFIPKAVLPLLDVPFSLASRVLPRPVSRYLFSARWLPVQHPEAATPQRGRPGRELRCDLEASHRRLVVLFRDNRDLDFGSFVHRHPLFGVNDAYGLLEFDARHERRHQEQIREVLRDLPPGAARGGADDHPSTSPL